jgi:hypothetical protein
MESRPESRPAGNCGSGKSNLSHKPWRGETGASHGPLPLTRGRHTAARTSVGWGATGCCRPTGAERAPASPWHGRRKPIPGPQCPHISRLNGTRPYRDGAGEDAEGGLGGHVVREATDLHRDDQHMGRTVRVRVHCRRMKHLIGGK